MRKTIHGNSVNLRPLIVDDAIFYHKWVKDKDVIKYSLSKWQRNYSKKEMKDWLANELSQKDKIHFGIIEKSTNNLIGNAGITHLRETNKSGEYFILIGEKESWGKGYGTEVTKLVVAYGFETLGLHRIMLTVSDSNIGGVKTYIKAGFKQEGVMRDASIRDGKFHNKIVMSILESEWNS